MCYMKIQDHPLYGGNIRTLLKLFRNYNKILHNLSIEEINSAIKLGYRVFYVPKKNGKKRIIEAPNYDLYQHLHKTYNY